MYQYKNYNFNDFDLLVGGDTLYAMYVKKRPYSLEDKDSKTPNKYGLAKTKDGFNWEEVGDILLPNPEEWDESLWAGGISKQDNEYVIYYTAVLEEIRQPSCKIGKAYSKDLIHWEKDLKNPVFIFDPNNPYYSDESKLSFRDPFYFEYEEKKYLIFCAKDKSKPSGKQGCIGVVEEYEKNRFRWLPPIFSPGKYKDGLECPALYNFNNKWYLFYGLDTHNAPYHQFRYAISEKRPFGPFREQKSNQLHSKGYFVGRIAKFKDNLLYYSWFRDMHKGKIRERLASPREVKFKENGEIKLTKMQNLY